MIQRNSSCFVRYFGLVLFMLGADQASSLSKVVASPKIKEVQKGAESINTRECNLFLANLRQRILNNWLLPDGNNAVVIEATISPSGDVLNTDTSKSKADAVAIAAASNAFEKAQPLGPLPPNYKSNCQIILTFTSDVDPHGDSRSHLTSRLEQIAKHSSDQGEAGNNTSLSGVKDATAK